MAILLNIVKSARSIFPHTVLAYKTSLFEFVAKTNIWARISTKNTEKCPTALYLLVLILSDLVATQKSRNIFNNGIFCRWRHYKSGPSKVFAVFIVTLGLQ